MSHRIENLTINCSDPSELDDFEVGQDFSTWVQNTVLQAIDDVLSKFDDSGVDIEIDELNLDLGDIHQDDFKQSFLAKLEANLEAQIHDVWKQKSVSGNSAFSSFEVTDEFLNKTKQKSKRSLQGLIHDGLYGKNVQALTAILPQLLKEYGQAFKNLLFGYAKDARVRKVIGHQFAHQHQDSLFKLLEPKHFNFIRDVLSNAGLFDAEGAELKSIENNEEESDQASLLSKVSNDKLSKDKQRPYLVEFTLAFLVTERGSQFNKNMYLRSVVKDLAAHNNVATKSLTLLLISQLAHSQLNTEFKADMLHLLTDLLADIDGDKAEQLRAEKGVSFSEANSPEEAPGSQSSSEYFAHFMNELSDGPVLTDVKLQQLMDSMGNKLKGTFSLIIDWLRRDHRSVIRLFEALQPQAAQRFTEQIITLKFANSGAEADSFSTAVKQFAQEAIEPKQFYRHLVEAILSNSNIDFDEIISQADIAAENQNQPQYSQAYQALETFVLEVVEDKRISTQFSLESQLRLVLDRPEEARKLLQLVNESQATERFKQEVGEVLWSLLCDSAEVTTSKVDKRQRPDDESFDDKDDSEKEVSAKQHLSAFLDLVNTQTRVSVASLQQLFTEMGAKRAGALALIIDQLRISETLRQTLVDKVDASASQYFVSELVEQKFSQTATAASNFMTTVSEYAAESQDQRDFYQRLIELLLLNKEIDFEALIAATNIDKTQAGNIEHSNPLTDLKTWVMEPHSDNAPAPSAIAPLVKALLKTPNEAKELYALANRTNKSLSEFRHGIGEALWAEFSAVVFDSEASHISSLTTQYENSDVADTLDTIDGKPRPVSEQEAWLLEVYKLINRGQWDGSVEQMQSLLDEHPETIEQVLRTEAKKSSVVQTLARKVEPEIQYRLLEFLAPSFANVIVDLASSAHILEGHIQGAKSGEDSEQLEMATHTTVSSQAVKSQWLEFSFHYLLVDRGSEFNTKSYLRSVLRQIARRDNQDYDEMIFSLRSILTNLTLSQEVLKSLTAILGEAPSEASSEGTRSKYYISEAGEMRGAAGEEETVTAQSQDIHRGFLVYEQLTSHLNKGHAASQVVIKDLITELVRHHRSQFLQLLADLRRNHEYRIGFYRLSDQSTLRLLIREVMQLTSHVNNKDGLELLGKVESFASGGPSPLAFYAEVISSLIDGQELNLRVVADKAQQTEQKLNAPDDLYSDLQQRKVGRQGLKDESLESLVEYCETVLNEKGRSQSLQTLMSIYNKAAPTIQAQSTLPEHLVSQCVEQAFDGDFSSLILFAQHLRIALTKAQLGLDLKQISELHWFAIILYVQSSPRTFNADRLTQIYLSVALYRVNKSVRGSDTSQAIKAIHGAIFVDANIANHVRVSLTDSLRSLSEQDLLQASPSLQQGQQQDSQGPHTQGHDSKGQAAAENKNVAQTKSPQDADSGLAVRDNDQSAKPESNPLVKPAQKDDVPPSTKQNSESSLGFPLQDEDILADGIEVLGAGVVLISPYISMLFSRLNLLENNQFKSEQHAAKGVHLLHYIVFGFTPLCFDELNIKPLFNLICGLEMDQCLNDEVELTESDEATCNGLLGSIIQQWSALGKTSVEGLRETFLQREGVLRYVTEQGWKLVVEESAYDVLLDRLPWSYATLRYQFMEDVLHVNWR